jgi:hypothetical protein
MEGAAGNAQEILDALEQLSFIRNPLKVPKELLPDLEREYGVSPDGTVPEDDRRGELSLARYKGASGSLVRNLQAVLDKGGFGANGYGLIVTPNGTPAADPGPVVAERIVLTAHEFPSAYAAGTSIAYAGERGGYYLVYGDRFNHRPVYPAAGRGMAALDFPSASCAGYFEDYIGYENEYTAPIPKDYWPFVFFVGGEVTRNSDGSIASVGMVAVPIGRRQELHRLILRAKPPHSWAGMVVTYQ